MHSLLYDNFGTFQLKSLNCYARSTFHFDLAWSYDFKNNICSNSFKIQIHCIFFFLQSFISTDIPVFISMYYDQNEQLF